VLCKGAPHSFALSWSLNPALQQLEVVGRLQQPSVLLQASACVRPIQELCTHWHAWICRGASSGNLCIQRLCCVCSVVGTHVCCSGHPLGACTVKGWAKQTLGCQLLCMQLWTHCCTAYMGYGHTCVCTACTFEGRRYVLLTRVATYTTARVALEMRLTSSKPSHELKRLRLVLLRVWQSVAALSIRRAVEAYSKGGLLTNDQPEAQRKLL
jgi:hypothetical protein